MANRGRPPGKKKDKFADLDNEFKDTVVGMQSAELRKRISDITLSQIHLNNVKEDDQDLTEKQEQVKIALEPYKDATTKNKLSILYIRDILKGRGEDVKED